MRSPFLFSLILVSPTWTNSPQTTVYQDILPMANVKALFFNTLILYKLLVYCVCPYQVFKGLSCVCCHYSPKMLSLLYVCICVSLVSGQKCEVDESVVPSCLDHLTPELEGLSFYLPHEYSECCVAHYQGNQGQTALGTGSAALSHPSESVCLSVLQYLILSSYTLTTLYVLYYTCIIYTIQ